MSHLSFCDTSWLDQFKDHYDNLCQNELWIVPSIKDFSLIQDVITKEDYQSLNRDRSFQKNTCVVSILTYSKVESLKNDYVPVMLWPTEKDFARIFCYIKLSKIESSFVFSDHAVKISGYLSNSFSLTSDENSYISEMEAVPSYPTSFVRDEKRFKDVISKYKGKIDNFKMVAHCLINKYPTTPFMEEYIKQLGGIH